MKSFIRVWQEKDVAQISKELLVMGELSAQCYACGAIGLDTSTVQCPECAAYFRYLGFRRQIDSHYLSKLATERPDLVFVDFEDIKKSVKKQEARDIFG